MDVERADPRRIARTAFFETVLLHARVLHDFLAGPPVDDDVWAGHYIEAGNPSSRSTEICESNQQAAHALRRRAPATA